MKCTSEGAVVRRELMLEHRTRVRREQQWRETAEYRPWPHALLVVSPKDWL